MNDDDLRAYFEQVAEGKTTTKEVVWCAVAVDGTLYSCYDGDWNSYAEAQHKENEAVLFYSKKPLTALLVRSQAHPEHEVILHPDTLSSFLGSPVPFCPDAHFFAYARYQSTGNETRWLYSMFGCALGSFHVLCQIEDPYPPNVFVLPPDSSLL